MMDLTKITEPFGELDQTTKWALKGAANSGEELQTFVPIHNEWETFHSTGEFLRAKIYRLKPLPVYTTLPMGAWVLENNAPILNPELGTESGWAQGTVTITKVEGKATRIVWEVAQ